MEHDAYYMVDDTGAAWALGGLNATLRDYAKFGQLYLNNGKWGNKQIVPKNGFMHLINTTDLTFNPVKMIYLQALGVMVINGGFQVSLF